MKYLLLLLFSANIYSCELNDLGYCSTMDEEDYETITFDCDNLKESQLCLSWDFPKEWIEKYSERDCNGKVAIMVVTASFINNINRRSFTISCMTVDNFNRNYKVATDE